MENTRLALEKLTASEEYKLHETRKAKDQASRSLAHIYMGDEESDNDLAGSVVNQSLNRSTLGLVTHDKSLEATEKKQTQ